MSRSKKIRVKSAIVEMDGDEMTRVMWKIVKERLLHPYLNMDVDYYDLHIRSRDETDDRITAEAARAIMRHGVGVKCATITPTEERVREYRLKKQWKSPNGTIREMLDGTVFRMPILVPNIRPLVLPWKRPIAIGRHAYGDIYSGAEMRVEGPGRAEIVFTPREGEPVRRSIKDFTGPGIIQGIHNTDESIENFARTCFMYALEKKMDLWFSAKDTVSQMYDARFREIFQHQYEHNWCEQFSHAGIGYFFTLIDDAAARIMRSEGGILWALKNYDGDVMSDMIASANGSLAMMTSVLVSPHGCYEYEAAHGTVQRHYYRHLRGEETSTNSMALIFAWTGAIRKRGELDGSPDVIAFADELEEAALATVAGGTMTGDLILVADVSPHNRQVNTEGFIEAIAANLDLKWKRN